LSHSQLDAVSSDLGLRVLLRHQIKVLLRDLQPAMSGDNIGVLDILIVQHTELPVGVLRVLGVLELGNLAEDSHLLNQALKSMNMDGESSIVGAGLNRLLFVLGKLLDPDGHHLFELRTSQETERCVLACRLLIAAADLLLQAVTQGFAKIRKLLLFGEGAERCHDLLPVGQVSIVHDIPQVLADDRRQQTNIVGAVSLLGEIVLLGLLDALLTTTDSNHESVRHAVLLQGNIESLLKVTDQQSPRDAFLGFGLGSVEDLEGVVGLGPLRGS
jgi:hypothetical protein